METTKLVDALCYELHINPDAVYLDTFEDKLISGSSIVQKFLHLFSASISSAYEYMNSVQPADPQQELAYKAAALARIAHLREQLITEAEQLTGCHVSVSVSVHASDPGKYPMFEPAKSMEGMEIGGHENTAWVKFAKSNHGEVTVFGRRHPKALATDKIDNVTEPAPELEPAAV